MFTKGFDNFACFGDSIECEKDGYRFVARIEHDADHDIDDDDCHNPDQSVTGCTDEHQAKLMAARTAWLKDEWHYVGVVISAYRNDVLLDDHAASLWGSEMNYPGTSNSYLLDVANGLLDEAMDSAESARESMLRTLES